MKSLPRVSEPKRRDISRDPLESKVAKRAAWMIQCQLNIQPTLTIRPGFSVRVIVTRDLVLASYDKAGPQ